MNDMIETYDIGEVRGNNGQINWVEFSIKFQLKDTDYYSIHGANIRLGASLPGDASDEDIHQACLNELGSASLTEIRNRQYNGLLLQKDRAINNQVFRKRDMVATPRLYGRLVLINHGLWDQVVNYFNDPARTEEEKAFFEDASIWRKDDPILQNAIATLGLTDDQFDTMFDEATTMLRASKEDL
jgi:hypothetical protein